MRIITVNAVKDGCVYQLFVNVKITLISYFPAISITWSSRSRPWGPSFKVHWLLFQILFERHGRPNQHQRCFRYLVVCQIWGYRISQFSAVYGVETLAMDIEIRQVPADDYGGERYPSAQHFNTSLSHIFECLFHILWSGQEGQPLVDIHRSISDSWTWMYNMHKSLCQ